MLCSDNGRCGILNLLPSPPLFRRTRSAVRSLLPDRSARLDIGDSRYSTCCHTFRATGIAAYLQDGGTFEHAQQIAAHQSPRTTKLYDRTRDEISPDEVERIKF